MFKIQVVQVDGDKEELQDIQEAEGYVLIAFHGTVGNMMHLTTTAQGACDSGLIEGITGMLNSRQGFRSTPAQFLSQEKKKPC